MLANLTKSNKWVIFIAVIFIAINSILIIKEQYWFSLLPLILLLALVYVYSLDKILLLIAFVTPLSLNIQSFDVGIGISLPSEPLLILLTGILIFKFLTGNSYAKDFLRHPITLSILFYIIWMIITSVTSEFPLVSFKVLVAKFWFIIPLYFFGVKVFENQKNTHYFIWMYVSTLIIVVFYTLTNHAMNGFTDKAAHWVMSPFYNDHTAYGAALAMYIPPVFGLIFWKKYNRIQKVLAATAFVILIVAMLFSISRAAWASVAGALGLYIIIKSRIKVKWFVLAGMVLVVLFFAFQEQIMISLEKNKQDSSDNLAEHVQSMSNIATDASNLERINRWHSAFRLFKERPLVGWGPGTYQFVYAPYQSSEDLTIISTNAGNKGTAHSEYFGPLCEQGVLGIFNILLIIILVSIYALRIIRKNPDKETRYLVLLLFLGLVTYFVHGVFNNFLDTDKLSVPFWGMIAVIVAEDLRMKRNIVK